MRTIEEVRTEALSTVRPTGQERVALPELVGRVLAEDIVAPHDVPSFANSAMDGFAVRATDVAAPGAVLRIIEDVAAGQTSSRMVGEGEATRIMTGAPMPKGADTVVRVEDTSEEDGKVRIETSPPIGTSVRPPGGDVAAGTTVFPAGKRLTAAHLGVLATIGVTTPLV
ncbi:MAG: molybdopterin molybdenumtransferase MoeA, partial [Acidimicrobiia bacterium]